MHSRSLRKCEGCGRRIPPERLRLLPETRHCVRCSDARRKTEADLDLDGADPAERLASFDGPSTGEGRW